MTFWRVDSTRLRTTAPETLGANLARPSCEASIYSFVIADGDKEFTLLGVESAPLQITLEIPLPSGGKGSGKGKGGSK